MNNVVSKPSSIFPADEQPNKILEHRHIPTVAILVFLFVVFFILKKFIYIKDEKRHDK